MVGSSSKVAVHVYQASTFLVSMLKFALKTSLRLVHIIAVSAQHSTCLVMVLAAVAVMVAGAVRSIRTLRSRRGARRGARRGRVRGPGARRGAPGLHGRGGRPAVRRAQRVARGAAALDGQAVQEHIKQRVLESHNLPFTQM